jgi:hypothetical protein
MRKVPGSRGRLSGRSAHSYGWGGRSSPVDLSSGWRSPSGLRPARYIATPAAAPKSAPFHHKHNNGQVPPIHWFQYPKTAPAAAPTIKWRDIFNMLQARQRLSALHHRMLDSPNINPSAPPYKPPRHQAQIRGHVPPAQRLKCPMIPPTTPPRITGRTIRNIWPSQHRVFQGSAQQGRTR